MVRLTRSFLHYSGLQKSFDYRFVRRMTAVSLMLLLGALLPPLPVQAATLRVAERRLSAAERHVWSWWKSVIEAMSHGQSNRERKGVRPVRAEGIEERAARVASIELNPASNVTLRSQQPLLFTAIPLDAEGNTIHGLRPLWSSSDRQVMIIKKNGEAVAGKPGTAIIVARIGNHQVSVLVTVVEGTKEPYGGKKKVDSKRSAAGEQAGPSNGSNTVVAPETNSRRKRAHAISKLTKPAVVMPFIRDPNEDPLPDNETSSLYQTNNLVGTPYGKTKPGALTMASAAKVSENGNKNFTFGLSIVDVPGRGIDASVSLIYNSLLWNKSTNPSDSSTWMTYDVDSGYPAQGFRLGFGQIEDQGSAGFTLTDLDGTRHALVFSSNDNYDTTDGTFIHFTGGSGWGTLFYPDHSSDIRCVGSRLSQLSDEHQGP